ncbi:MAG: hypothetical protein BroJett040_07750 [Oligoflexia bacterium]|nr:MAG: hypothetical protein BroJett040_07750 [Oligoflexia bacterium]
MGINLSKFFSDQGPIGSRRERLKAFFDSRRFLYPFFIVSTCLFLIGLALSFYQIFHLTTEYSFNQFLPKNHNLLLEDKKIRKTFLLSDKSSLVYVLHTDTEQGWLNPEKYSWLKAKTEKLKDLKNVKNVFTFQSLQNAIEKKNDLLIGSPFDESPPATWPELALSNPLISPQLLTADFKSTLLLIEPSSSQTLALEKLQEQISEKLQAKDVTASLGGALAAQNRLSTILGQELKIFLILSVIIFCLVFLFLFSSPSALFLIVFTLLFTNMFHLAWLSTFRIPLNVLLSTLPVINSISVMSLIIHSLHLWTQKKSEARPSIASSFSILKELFLPNLLGTLTTSIGFIALWGAQIPIIQQYAWIIAISVVISWALAQWILLYAFTAFTYLQKPPQMRKWFDRPAYWNFFAVKYNRPIFFSILGLTIVAAFFFPRLNFDSQLYSDLPKQDIVSRTNQWLDQHMGGTVSYELVLIAPRKEFWLTPEKIQALRNVQTEIRKIPSIGGVYSPSEFLPQNLPKKKAAISELFFLYSMSPEDPTRQYINPSADRIRLSIKFKDLPTDQLQLAQAQIDQQLTSTFPEVKIQKGGAAVYAHEINQKVSRKLVFGFWESIILIGTLLVLTFRSLRWALVACIPNAIAPILMIAGLAITKTPIKPSIALIFSISLGLAFNNTVYFLSRLKSLVETKQLHFLPLRRALSLEGNPCLFETFVMLAGFSIFLISQFQVNKLFGVLMVLSICLGFVGDMIFLPALLKFFPQLLLSKSKILPIHTETSSNLRPIGAWLAFFIFISGSPAKATQLTAKEILTKTRTQIEASDEFAQVKMTIIEANGDKKVRELLLKARQQGDKASTLVKIMKPADVKGMGLLSLIENGSEKHWIYLPQSKQVRRVVGSQTQSGVLGSELSAADMNSEILKGAKAKLLSSTKPDQFQIEVSPAKGAQFTKAILTISNQFLPQKIEYFSQNQLKKTVLFKGYSQHGAIWRPKEIQIRNHLNKRGTDLILSHQKVNQGLKDSEFSQSALKDDL